MFETWKQNVEYIYRKLVIYKRERKKQIKVKYLKELVILLEGELFCLFDKNQYLMDLNR